MKKIQINVNPEIYEQYQKICRAENTSVSIELRNFMKQTINKDKDNYVNIAHEKLDIAMKAIVDLALTTKDKDLQNDILSIKSDLIITTLDKI